MAKKKVKKATKKSGFGRNPSKKGKQSKIKKLKALSRKRK